MIFPYPGAASTDTSSGYWHQQCSGTDTSSVVRILPTGNVFDVS
jgi:hypothetical protein